MDIGMRLEVVATRARPVGQTSAFITRCGRAGVGGQSPSNSGGSARCLLRVMELRLTSAWDTSRQDVPPSLSPLYQTGRPLGAWEPRTQGSSLQCSVPQGDLGLGSAAGVWGPQQRPGKGPWPRSPPQQSSSPENLIFPLSFMPLSLALSSLSALPSWF